MTRNLYIFDCFGVVMSEVSTLFMERYLNDEQIRYMRTVCRKLDLGKIKMDDLYAELSAVCKLDIERVKTEWVECEAVNTDTIEVINKLRAQGHCVALLSNAAVEYIDYLFNKYDLFKYFDCVFVSAEYGYAKPDMEFYKLCVDSFTEHFDRTYFTDDNPVNLVDLQQFGITPVLFTSAKDFAEKVGV